MLLSTVHDLDPLLGAQERAKHGARCTVPCGAATRHPHGGMRVLRALYSVALDPSY